MFVFGVPIMETIYQKYAKLLVHYSLRLKKGDKLLIMSSYLAEELLKEVYREALAAGHTRNYA